MDAGASAAPACEERWYASQEGLRLFFRDYGPRHGGGIPALCLPGLTRNGKDFESLALHLARHRRVLCPDYRGRGRSERASDRRDYHPRRMLDDMRHLLVACGVERVVVIGTSIGGILAAGLAVAVPGQVAGVVLNDIVPEPDRDGLKRLSANLRAMAPQPDWESAAAAIKARFVELPARDDASWMVIARNTFCEENGRMVPDWDPAVTLAIAGGDRSAELWPLFRALRRVPVLALRGERSSIVTAAAFDRLLAALPMATGRTIPGVGHAPDIGAPEIREDIDELFARIENPGL